MSRHSILNVRHRELGSKLDGDTWNGMPIPWRYDTDPYDEVVAVRTRAGLYDVSALNMLNVSGPDAEAVLDMMVAKDVTKLKPGTSLLAAEVDAAGAICDDIMIIRDGPTHFRVSHGSGCTAQTLRTLSIDRKVQVTIDSDVHILSLQGPKSIEILEPNMDVSLAGLPYFFHQKATLFGRPVIVARGGYSGELWDQILKAGKPYGALAASWNSLDITRVEASLLFYPYDMPEGDTTPWEVNMGWGVDLDKKGDYIGKYSVLAARGHERFKQAGLICDSAMAVEVGAKIFHDGIEVGIVTSATYSRYLMLSLAMVHLNPQFTALGLRLQVVGKHMTCHARVSRTPFYDPMRLRTHPEHHAVPTPVEQTGNTQQETDSASKLDAR